jgi:hypothetical protein
MDILLNVIPYFIIIMIFAPLSSVVYGLSLKYVEEDKLLEEGKKEKIKFKPKYNALTIVVSVVVECVLYAFHGISIPFLVYSFLSHILLISAITDFKACIIPNETNFVRIHSRNYICIYYYFG